MKKIFLALAAVAAITACSKTEAEYEQTGEIAFVPVTENMTKSMVTTATFPTTEKINLWAYYKPVPAGSVGAWISSTEKAQTYIEDKTFAYKETEGKWGGDANPYFWPKNGSLVFVGYYPSSLKNSVNHDLTTQTMTFIDITQSRVASTGYSEDIMYFNMTPSCSNGSVTAEFKHALSWVSVLLKKDSNTSERATITVNKVTFTEVNPCGDAKVVAQQTINWTVDGTPASVEILEGTPVVLSKTNETVQAYQPLFIPQDMNGNLVVEYEIKSEDGSKFTEVATIALSGMKSGDTSLKKWLPAKHYTYTITIGTSEILVNPTLETWEAVPVNPTI